MMALLHDAKNNPKQQHGLGTNCMSAALLLSDTVKNTANVTFAQKSNCKTLHIPIMRLLKGAMHITSRLELRTDQGHEHGHPDDLPEETLEHLAQNLCCADHEPV